MLECRDGRLYTGITTDIKRRLTEHNTGRLGARFTRANPPIRLLAAQQIKDRSAALKLEAALKKLKRPQKQRWAAENQLSTARSDR
jgi:putative endonuclease